MLEVGAAVLMVAQLELVGLVVAVMELLQVFLVSLPLVMELQILVEAAAGLLLLMV
jgi:hypothetical protein